ncbi:MAG: serine/threonine protein kinase [Gemmatimonadota bacterium]|nr:serine/threonine protein kinase [Gemmatimonadota bacterium]
MAYPILRSEIQLALGADYTIDRQLPRPPGIIAYSARGVHDGSRVGISAIPTSVLSMSPARGDASSPIVPLQHANILPISRSGTLGDIFYWIAAEADAQTLRARLIARDSRVSLKDSLILLRDVSAALTHAHSHGVVHGGLTPDSVLISGGSALVANIGIARVFASLDNAHNDAMPGPGIGESFRYTSPEQATGAPADARSDVYAWGVIAYELLSGRHPFSGRATPREMLAAHTGEVPPQLLGGRFNVPSGVARLVMRCLSKEPGKRPQAAGEILNVLTKELLTPPPAAAAGSGQKLAIALVVALGAAVALLAMLG